MPHRRHTNERNHVMPPSPKEDGFALPRSTAATRPATNEASIQDPLQPHWLLWPACRGRTLWPSPRPVAASSDRGRVLSANTRSRKGFQRHRPGLPRRFSATGSEGWILNLSKISPRRRNPVKLILSMSPHRVIGTINSRLGAQKRPVAWPTPFYSAC